MKELKQLIANGEFIQAKTWIHDNHHRFHEIAEFLLETIESFDVRVLKIDVDSLDESLEELEDRLKVKLNSNVTLSTGYVLEDVDSARCEITYGPLGEIRGHGRKFKGVEYYEQAGRMNVTHVAINKDGSLGLGGYYQRGADVKCSLEDSKDKTDT